MVAYRASTDVNRLEAETTVENGVARSGARDRNHSRDGPLPPNGVMTRKVAICCRGECRLVALRGQTDRAGFCRLLGQERTSVGPGAEGVGR